MLRQPFFRVVGVAMRVAIVLFARGDRGRGASGSATSPTCSGTERCEARTRRSSSTRCSRWLQSLLAYALVLRPLRLLRMVSRHRVLVRRRLDRGLGLLAAAAWVYATLSIFGVAGSAASLSRRRCWAPSSRWAPSRSRSATCSCSPSRVWLSFALARFVNFVLEEDVFPRMRLAARRAVRHLEPGAVHADLPRLPGRPGSGGHRARQAHGGRGRSRGGHRLRPAERGEQLRLGPDPALRAADPGG